MVICVVRCARGCREDWIDGGALWVSESRFLETLAGVDRTRDWRGRDDDRGLLLAAARLHVFEV